MKYIIGIDIGGTKISIVLATPRGKILYKVRLKTKKQKNSRKSVQDILHFISGIVANRKLKSKNLLGIGIGVPGPVDPERQRIEYSPNLPGWEGIALTKILSKKFRCPVFLENDANAAALGEKYFGSGKGIADLVYVTVSTGIGSGIIANGELVSGAKGAAGEIGHTTIVKAGEPCKCGKRGCLETYSSGTAIAKFAVRALRKNRSSKITQFCKKKNEITGETVSLAAQAGDKLAIQIRQTAADYLGVGLANAINTLNPKRIILGGGVLEHTVHFWNPMMRAIKRESWRYSLAHCKIMLSRLGGRVADYGTVAVVLQRRGYQ